MRETEYEGVRGWNKTQRRAGWGREGRQEGKNASGLASRDDRAGIHRESDKVGRRRVARGDLRQGGWRDGQNSTQGPVTQYCTDHDGVTTKIHQTGKQLAQTWVLGRFLRTGTKRLMQRAEMMNLVRWSDAGDRGVVMQGQEFLWE